MALSDDGPLNLAPEPESTPEELLAPWKLLIIDDEPDVHAISRVVLQDERFFGRRVELLDAFSGREAIDILSKNPDIAVVLLDVIMETEDAGFRVAQFIRQEMENNDIRIIVRTGQPTNMLASDFAKNYCVNYYEPKIQLTASRLVAIINMALQTYQATTELKAANKQLAQSIADNKLFTDAIAHDLKSPARQIHLLTEILCEELREGGDQERIEQIRSSLEESSEKLVSTIDGLLGLARYNESSLNICSVDIKELIDKTLMMHAKTLYEIGATIRNEAHGKVMADPEVLGRVLQNLLENSIKYRSPKRQLELIFSSRLTEHYTEIELHDNGLGIDDDTLDVMFLPFKRGNQSTHQPGCGIGLTASKRIMEMHGGEICARQRKPDGTTLCLCLPTSN